MKRTILPAILIVLLACVTLGGPQPTTEKKTALLLIDIQNFYFPGGKLPLVNPEKASLQAKKILEKFREKKELVIHVRYLAGSGSSGSRFNPGLPVPHLCQSHRHRHLPQRE